MENYPTGVIRIRGIMGWCHILHDQDTCILLDTGMAGEPAFVERALRKIGRSWKDVDGILLTHGHLDHGGNLARFQELSGAPVYGHRMEQLHLDGKYPYEGKAVWCGRLERWGSALFRYRPGVITDFIQDGQVLPFWGGLKVVHTPGHTAGHCAFYNESQDVLFSGDLFASYFFNTHFPPAILNSCPDLLPSSFLKVVALDPKWIVPNHHDFADGPLHKRRFLHLCSKLGILPDKIAA
ncbi:MAG: MBL fold metallo-hydrolase [Verrucomicrobiota bacterium]|nr:MBL fold metallo-hydrolase [Verrucomicrobiota bacterium]